MFLDFQNNSLDVMRKPEMAHTQRSTKWGKWPEFFEMITKDARRYFRSNSTINERFIDIV